MNRRPSFLASRRRLAAAALLAPLLLGACGTAQAEPSPQQTVKAAAVAEIKAGPTFNATDVMFLQMMVYHQKQGLEMTATATQRTTNPRVKTFALAVTATENEELTMMQSWLTEWAKPVNVDTNPNLHASHGGLPATGPAEIKALHTVAAKSFDMAFLNLFLAHQHNALEMATMETTDGTNAETKKLAARITESRQAEVQQMLNLMNP